MIYLCKEADIFDIDIYIDIYICWYLYLLDICNQDSLYNLTLVYVVISDRNTFSEENLSDPYFMSKVTLKLSLASFSQYSTYCQWARKNYFVKSAISTKNWNQRNICIVYISMVFHCNPFFLIYGERCY